MWKIVLVGFSPDYYNNCFYKMKDIDSFIFLDNTMGNGVLSKLQKICVSERVNKLVNIPFKRIWINDFSKWLGKGIYEDDICFVFSKNQSWLLEYHDGLYFQILRKKYPRSKIVMYLTDVISSFFEFDVSFFKEKCDYVFSYDKDDSENYDLMYVPLPYSKVTIPKDKRLQNFDVFFCGKAKNRLDEIHNIYDYLTDNGFKCLFFVTGVERSKRRSDGIIYNHRIKYSKYLQYMSNSKAILEVIQKDSNGDTLRVKEALSYSKLLITNNCDIIRSVHYNPEQIFIYEKKSGMNINLFKKNLGAKFDAVSFEEFYQIINELCMKNVIDAVS